MTGPAAGGGTPDGATDEQRGLATGHRAHLSQVSSCSKQEARPDCSDSYLELQKNS